MAGNGWSVILRLQVRLRRGALEAFFDKTWRPGEIEEVNWRVASFNVGLLRKAAVDGELKHIICEIFEAPRFLSFSTQSAFWTCRGGRAMSAPGARPDMPLNPRHFRFSPTSEVGDGIR